MAPKFNALLCTMSLAMECATKTRFFVDTETFLWDLEEYQKFKPNAYFDKTVKNKGLIRFLLTDLQELQKSAYTKHYTHCSKL